MRLSDYVVTKIRENNLRDILVYIPDESVYYNVRDQLSQDKSVDVTSSIHNVEISHRYDKVMLVGNISSLDLYFYKCLSESISNLYLIVPNQKSILDEISSLTSKSTSIDFIQLNRLSDFLLSCYTSYTFYTMNLINNMPYFKTNDSNSNLTYSTPIEGINYIDSSLIPDKNKIIDGKFLTLKMDMEYEYSYPKYTNFLTNSTSYQDIYCKLRKESYRYDTGDKITFIEPNLYRIFHNILTQRDYNDIVYDNLHKINKYASKKLILNKNIILSIFNHVYNLSITKFEDNDDEIIIETIVN